tara:strand:- start:1424 stop:3088 length:1665 start_codon:yes stop_codon:yes gene_type:complete
MSYVGNPLANAFSSREKQDLTGQSGTSFTLTHAVSHANDLSVYINHVRQEPTTAYSVNGTTLTTTGSVAGTDDFYIIYDELAVQSISHPTDQALTATSGTFTSGLVGTTATFSGAISGTLGTAAQPNITSTGTLTGLTVDGDATLTGANYNVTWDKSDNALEFGDNAKLTFGAGNDLQIYHTPGTGSFIDEADDGSLFIRSSRITMHKYTGETMINAAADSAVSLYYDDSKKLSTATNGVEIYNGSTGNTPTIIFKDMNSGVVGGDEGGGIYWYTNDGNGQGNNASIRSIYQNAAGGTALLFGTGTGSTRYDRIVIREGGKVSIGDQTGGAGLYVTNTYDYGYGLTSNANTQQLKGGVAFVNPDTGDSSVNTNIFHQPNRFGWSMFYCNKIVDAAPSNDNRYFDFYWNTTSASTKGTIKYNYSSGVMEYNTTSDYRLKDNIQDANISTLYEDMKKVKVRTFHMKKDHDPGASDTIGLIAHEAQEVWSQVCDKPKDAVKDDIEGGTKDSDGNPAKVPDYQELDYGKFTPMIMGALQKAMEKIEALEAKVKVLESK